MAGGPTALAPPAMGWGPPATAFLPENPRTDGQQRRVSWKAVDERKGKFSTLPVRTGHGVGGTADLSSSDETDDGAITVPALVSRDPLAAKNGADGSAGSLKLVLDVVERLKER